MLSDVNLQISQKITTIPNLAKISLVKANKAQRKSLNFAKIAKVTRIFYCNKKNTLTNIATIKAIINFGDLRVSAANEWNILSSPEEEFRIAKWSYNVFLNYININETENQFNLIDFWCERREILRRHSNGNFSRV